MIRNFCTAALPLRASIGSSCDFRCASGSRPEVMEKAGEEMTRPRIVPFMVAGLVLGLTACTNPYDPVQRMIGGGLIGAGSGAAIGAAAAGGHGAAMGAAIGGAVGAVGGLITTPSPPAYNGYYNQRHYASFKRRRHHCVDCQAAMSTPTAAQTNAPSRY